MKFYDWKYVQTEAMWDWEKEGVKNFPPFGEEEKEKTVTSES